MPDCFISYSRRDAPFVTRLAEALKSRGKVPWVDLADIPVSADWRVELTEGIAGSDAFIAVISPDWLASAVCQRELEEAAHFNKRIIPIMYRETAEAKVPDVLATPNWVMSREEDDFDQAVDKLVSAIDTDLARVKAHTRLLLRSNEWAGSEDASLLVRGNELSRAQALVALPGSPAPTPLQQRFVAASAAASHQRQRRLLAGVSAALVVAVVLAVVALVQRDSAVHNQHEAESTALTTESVAQLQVDPQRSVSLALSAMRQATTAGALLALRQGVSADQLRHTLPGLTGKIAFGGSGPQSIAFDPADPNTLATEAPGGVIRVWDASLGSAVASLRPARASPELALERFVFNNEGSLLAAVYSDGTVRIWDMRSYKLNAPVARTDSLPVSLSFSSGGGNLYLFEDDGAVVAIDPATGTVTGSRLCAGRFGGGRRRPPVHRPDRGAPELWQRRCDARSRLQEVGRPERLHRWLGGSPVQPRRAAYFGGVVQRHGPAVGRRRPTRRRPGGPRRGQAGCPQRGVQHRRPVSGGGMGQRHDRCLQRPYWSSR